VSIMISSLLLNSELSINCKMPEKTIQLKPSHTTFFWWYCLGVLLVPVIGIGLIVIYIGFKKQAKTTYIIGNQSIIKSDHSYREAVDLVNITDIKVQQRWIDKKFNNGTLILITETKSIDLIGIHNPSNLSELILKAAEAERTRINNREKIPKPSTNTPPVSLDRLDYLTGLWQQGLLSDEDFKKEKKHFEP